MIAEVARRSAVALRILPATGMRCPSEEDSVPPPQRWLSGNRWWKLTNASVAALQGVLTQVPGGAPGQTVGGDVGHLGHAGEAKVTALRQEGGIEDGQEVGPARFMAIEMAQVLTEAGPLVHFDEQVGQVDQGQARRDVVFQAVDTARAAPRPPAARRRPAPSPSVPRHLPLRA